uniref:Uncharacterized protein n=1 Tax=Ditylenchus dipsaci TaxID=166011 RepID=A0A915DEY8_9BILA
MKGSSNEEISQERKGRRNGSSKSSGTATRGVCSDIIRAITMYKKGEEENNRRILTSTLYNNIPVNAINKLCTANGISVRRSIKICSILK